MSGDSVDRECEERPVLRFIVMYLLCSMCILTACLVRADVVFALDASGSCGPENFQKQLDFLTDMAVGLNLRNSTNRMGLVSFADEGVLQFGLDSFNDTVGVVDGIAQPYL